MKKLWVYYRERPNPKYDRFGEGGNIPVLPVQDLVELFENLDTNLLDLPASVSILDGLEGLTLEDKTIITKILGYEKR